MTDDAAPAARIEAERERDAFAIREVLARAFAGQPMVADMVDAIRASPHYEPALALVARIGEMPDAAVGFVMISNAQLRGEAGERQDLLTLSPLAVHPDWQRRGIGSALVTAVLAAAEARPDLPRLVTLEGSPSYYGRLGFTLAGDCGVQINLPDWAPPAAAQVYRLTGYDPALRGMLVYPPAFDLVE